MNGKYNGKYVTGTVQPFCGQLSSIFFFEEALTSVDVMNLADVHPSHFANVNPSTNGFVNSFFVFLKLE